MGCCQNSSLGPEAFQVLSLNDVPQLEPIQADGELINDRLRQSLVDKSESLDNVVVENLDSKAPLEVLIPQLGEVKESNGQVTSIFNPQTIKENAPGNLEVIPKQNVPLKVFAGFGKKAEPAPSKTEIEADANNMPQIVIEKVENQSRVTSENFEVKPKPNAPLKLFAGFGKKVEAAPSKSLEEVANKADEITNGKVGNQSSLDPLGNKIATNQSAQVINEKVESQNNAAPENIEAKPKSAFSLKLFGGLMKKSESEAAKVDADDSNKEGNGKSETKSSVVVENKPKMNASLMLFSGLVKKTAERVIAEAEKIDMSEINQQIKDGIADPSMLLDNEVGEALREGIRRSTTLIQEQVAIIKEGLQEAVNRIKDFNLKKRVTDIVYPILRKVFIHSTACSIESKYNIHEIIGRGSYSTVRKAVDLRINIERAAKIIVKNSISEGVTSTLISEVEALKTLDHPNIIRVVEIIEDISKLCIVTELCKGGELFDRIIKTKGFDEALASHYMYQILSGLIHIHKAGYIHRDLKPENILFLDEDSNTLKIIDFGLSKTSAETKKVTRCIGTVSFI